VDGSRRLSQAISEGDGISLIARVTDAASARAAAEGGAEALAVSRTIPELREATALPVLWLGPGPSEGADACLLRVDEDDDEELETDFARFVASGYECVVDVSNEDELQLSLDRLEPEIFLISPREADDEADALDHVLELLPDVPAGKLAIAEVPSADRDVVTALERAGFDAVLVAGSDVAGLVPGEHPPV
jgi:hypothetical protein